VLPEGKFKRMPMAFNWQFSSQNEKKKNQKKAVAVKLYMRQYTHLSIVY
jgi:hypothetical protein